MQPPKRQQIYETVCRQIASLARLVTRLLAVTYWLPSLFRTAFQGLTDIPLAEFIKTHFSMIGPEAFKNLALTGPGGLGPEPRLRWSPSEWCQEFMCICHTRLLRHIAQVSDSLRYLWIL